MYRSFFSYILLISILSSCGEVGYEKISINITEENGVLGNNIGLRSTNGTFQKFTSESLNNYILESFGDGSFDLKNLTLKRNFTELQDEEFYTMHINNLSRTISIAFSLTLDEVGGYYFVSGSCKCETNSCSQTNGCEAYILGGLCACSPCTGDCKKVTEVKTDQ